MNIMLKKILSIQSNRERSGTLLITAIWSLVGYSNLKYIMTSREIVRDAFLSWVTISDYTMPLIKITRKVKQFQDSFQKRHRIIVLQIDRIDNHPCTIGR